ncbi:UbiA family prenyltransferase [Roseivirga sp.]|uniref:UbiA family prenyltransferase n=1 Tax=Roseivirga sp. TaxID=1964215 RepID=UPI003B8D07B3
MQKVVSIVQNLSLDITIGALISCLFIGKVFQVNISLHMLFGLGIAIWLIYTFDHLRDAQSAKSRPSNPRHAFHYDYRKPLIVVAVIFFIVGLVNAFYLPFETIQMGVVLAILSVLYFVYIRISKRQLSKEIFAALVYTAGVFTAPLSLVESMDWTYWILMFQFLLMACANLMIIPLYEVRIDKRDEVNSLVIYLGEPRSKVVIQAILGLNLVIIALFLTVIKAHENAQFIFFAMGLALVILLGRNEFFRKHQLYRIICDGIFFLPIFYWL